jgi:hypothetical protein
VSTAADAALIRDCVAGYAARLHAAAGQGHHVVSPLGAWLLLALCGTGPGTGGRAALGEVLGCDAGTAARLAAELLARPHPQAAAAAAVWASPLPDHLRAWQASLPPAVQAGPVPTREQADAWAREHTFGLIDRFPLDLAGANLALATALASRVSWQQPFDLAPAASLGTSSPWAGLGQVLATPRHPAGHEQFVAVTRRAGDVIVHLAQARDGLLVASVAAAPGVPPADVLAAAHDIGPAAVSGGSIDRRPVAALPLGDGPLWQVTEVPGPGRDACTAVLPAWSAQTRLDLRDPSLGVSAAVAALQAPGRWTAAQAAMARYTRTGFEAAAVTAMARQMAMVRPPGGRHREARLRFAFPYAVVAVARDPGPDGTAGPWHGVPVFSAWVADPQDATDPQDAADPA